MFTCDIYVNMQHNYVDTHVFVFLNLGRRLTLNWGQISAPFPKTKSDVFSPLYFQKFPICFYILILKSFFKSNSKMKTFQERELIFQNQNLFQRKYQFCSKGRTNWEPYEQSFDLCIHFVKQLIDVWPTYSLSSCH